MTVVVAAGAAAPVAAQDAPLPAPAPTLAPGDAVRITVWRKEELSGEVEVSADSTLAHPLYRGIRAVGIPFPELEARIRARLLDFETNPQFVVQPLLRVAVGGEVRQPNLYAVGPEVTVLQALALAGGLSDRGRIDRVQLVRGGVSQVLDLTRPETGSTLVTVRSGDQIFVQRRRDVFREYVAPVASIVAAVAALARAFTN